MAAVTPEQKEAADGQVSDRGLLKEQNEGGDNEKEPQVYPETEDKKEIEAYNTGAGEDKTDGKGKEADEEEQYLLEMSQPNCLTNVMVNRPCLVICLSFALMLLISVGVSYMGWMNPDNPTDRDYMVWGDPHVTNFDKSTAATRELVVVKEGEVAPLQSQVVPEWTSMLVFSNQDEDSTANMWNKAQLIAIRNFEEKVKLLDDYKESCVATPVAGGTAD